MQVKDTLNSLNLNVMDSIIFADAHSFVTLSKISANSCGKFNIADKKKKQPVSK